MRFSPGASSRHDRGRWFADAVRVVAVLSVIVGAVWLGFPQTLGLAIMAAGLVSSRIYRLPGPFDAAFCLTILIATWSGMIGLYRGIPWWDLMVHFVTVGASAAALQLILARAQVTPSGEKGFPAHSVVIVTFTLGMTIAVLWEFGEWMAHTFFSDAIIVGYDDTIGDLAVGGAGAAVAGLALVHWTRRARFRHHQRDESGDLMSDPLNAQGS